MMQNRIAVEGSWVAVDVYGEPDGPAIVIIPGAMSDAAAWAQVARSLEGWRTVAVVNRRGRKPSGPLTDTYSLQTEVKDAATVVRSFSNVRTLFGWSYGGLIALHLASELSIPHVIAYEPVMRPFGCEALPSLRKAHQEADFDTVTETALRRVTGAGDDIIKFLRANAVVWGELRRLSASVYPETLAINEAPQPTSLATKAERIDLIVGELNRGQAPYGTSFDDIVKHVLTATAHELSEQRHLAHLEAPVRLGALISKLAQSAVDQQRR